MSGEPRASSIDPKESKTAIIYTKIFIVAQSNTFTDTPYIYRSSYKSLSKILLNHHQLHPFYCILQRSPQLVAFASFSTSNAGPQRLVPNADTAHRNVPRRMILGVGAIRGAEAAPVVGSFARGKSPVRGGPLWNLKRTCLVFGRTVETTARTSTKNNEGGTCGNVTINIYIYIHVLCFCLQVLRGTWKWKTTSGLVFGFHGHS